MKETTKMSRAVSQLEHIYNSLNTDCFNGELPMPIITVQSKPGTFGHCIQFWILLIFKEIGSKLS